MLRHWVDAVRSDEGITSDEDLSEGGLIDPPPDCAKMAESVGCYGENVSDPAEVAPALQRALKVVRDGTPAVVAVRLPQLMVETRERA